MDWTEKKCYDRNGNQTNQSQEQKKHRRDNQNNCSSKKLGNKTFNNQSRKKTEQSHSYQPKKNQYSKNECFANKNSDNISESNSNEKNGSVRNMYFGFKRLQELCEKDPSEIVFVMTNKTNGFMDLFKQNKDPDWIFLLIKVSAKICSTEFHQSKMILLSELACYTFLEHLKQYILTAPMEKNRSRCNNMNAFFNDCTVVFQSVTNLFPKTAVERLKEVVESSDIALTGIKRYNNNVKINETTLIDMEDLLQKLSDIKLSDKLNLEEKLVYDNIAQLLPPPCNFRELTLYPTATDLEPGEPFLRPNITKGVYQDVEHYLDVQFRLLREDFIAPLREGIRLYKERQNDTQHNQCKKKINNIRIYQNVQFNVRGEFVYDKFGFLIHFNINNKLKVNWEMARRFMYGSLLIFTVNNFNTFFMGVVLERKIELLSQGKLIVELLENARPLYNTSYTMIESEVFFEPYKCSLEVLKNIKCQNFPMEKYIISACNKIDYPYYIETSSLTNYIIDDIYDFDIKQNYSWPTKEHLGLDEMQYEAFTAALTHEFTVIQGPPGTGKTYIGLKIIKTIINNLYKNKILTKPILVICFTNHALDQFMEGILSFTNKVVRIGGQSKSETLEKYNLKNITRFFRRSVTTNIGLRSVSERLKVLMHEINYLKKCSEFVSLNAGILELSLLKNGMPKYFHKFFRTTKDLLAWLFHDPNHSFLMDPIKLITAIGDDLVNKVFHSENLLKVSEVVYDEDGNTQYEADDPDLEFKHGDIVIFSLTLDDVKSVCMELLQESIHLEKLINSDVTYYNAYEEVKFNFNAMEEVHDYFTNMLSLINVCIDIPRSIRDLSILNMNQRWALYFQWVKNTQQMFAPKIINCEKIYSQFYKQYTELRELENIEILNKMDVVALTTTGAAKHRIMLEGLQSPIVIVEEAAEVLEAHIVSSLTRHCHHLILIGDHKQLRPNNAVYKLAKDFNFDISLFERMVNNSVPCYTLGVQHRMRPEIASLICPTIYPILKNHTFVFNRENVRGVTKNLFFLNHNVYEKEVEEIQSKSNDHEALFLISLARHLLLQDYKSDQITILTTYSGQMFKLRALRKKYPILQNLKIVVVDNYQGEESDIILLSLVRSNEKGNVGFLKTENRICVALSRAKYGLYIMGNMDNLYNSGNLWKQIKETLVNQDSYGDELILECAVHSGITTKVSKHEDFNLIMEGGCTMLCKSLLSCGHYCFSICHSYDREHKELKCREPCNKTCDYNHPCMKKCYMDCGKCSQPVTKKLPCGHELILPCYVDPETFSCEEKMEIILNECGHTIIKKCHEKDPNCTFKCFDRLDCGHSCERNCHKNDDADHVLNKCKKPCEKINKDCSLSHKCKKLCYEDCSFCTVIIKTTLPCGHTKDKVPCGLNRNKIKCFYPCSRILECNHKCQAKCFETCKACEFKVKKVIPDCGHSVTLMCKIKPERKYCNKICNRTLECGHKCKNLCAEICTNKKCKEIVLKGTGKLSCGHNKIWVLCCDKDKDFSMNSQYLLDKCQEPCLQTLNCNDICLATCGECKQGRLHVPCSEPCNKINPCNHTCKYPCKERCPPCNEKCLYSCIHSRCTNICGKPCVPCKEDCEWKCLHLACTKKCGDICNRQPCYESCGLKLVCGHNCIGFCGEPCPPLCRICHKDEVTTIIFGNEDEPDARFVYLNDCKHCIESEALEQWMSQTNEEISLKQCPLCKTPILKTQRFMNHVKIIMEDIFKIKQKLYGEIAAIKVTKNTILKSLKVINSKLYTTFIENLPHVYQKKFSNISNLWDNFYKPLLNDFKRENFSLSARDVESLNYVIGLFKSISKYMKQINKINDNYKKQDMIIHFFWLLSIAFKFARKLSNQQKFDINLEMVRGARLLCFYEIIFNNDFKLKIESKTQAALDVKDLISNVKALLLSCQKYSQSRDNEIQISFDLITKKIQGIPFITGEERKMIHQAMSVSFHSGIKSQGHWCKCKNGHIYCITECGGPMEKALCPECKVEIGGSSHRHVADTFVATEMDGARQLAFTSNY